MDDWEFVEHAARLAPVFVAPPNGKDYHRPPGWQDLDLDGNADRLQQWREGYAVCAVTGTHLAVVDVDPRNGGDVDTVAQTLAGLGVTVLAEVVTPGGGRHFYVAGHPELPKANNLQGYPGVDIQSHGANVYLPGTRRAKYDGRGYEVVSENLEGLADGGDPDGAEALVGFVLERRQHRASAGFTPSSPWTGEPPDARQAAYLEKVLTGQYKEVLGAPDGSQNDVLYDAALKCGSFVAGAGMDGQEVERLLMDAATRNGYVAKDGAYAARRSIRSGLENGKANPRAVPDSADVTVWEPSVQVEVSEEDTIGGRRIVLTPASAIKPRRVMWLWEGRLAVGTLSLLAGREGLGKSTLAYWLAARVTRGDLPGENFGVPKSVLVCATEDSWEHTIVPRLIAADADLDRVYRTEVVTSGDLHFGLSLPRDLLETERVAEEVEVSLLLLDPLMSRLAASLDTHRDGDVRQALEPLVALADRARMSVLGLIHHNKSGSTDPLQLVMGSKAFTAVARSVHTVVEDPEDETGIRRFFGTPKNNLGRTDLPTLAFTIEGYPVETVDGTAWTGRVVWGEELSQGIAETMRRAAEPEEVRTAVADCAAWLEDYVFRAGGIVKSAEAKNAGMAAGHSKNSINAARKRLGLFVENEKGWPRITYWGNPALVDPKPVLGTGASAAAAS